MKTIIKNNGKWYLLLGIIVLLQTIYISYVFAHGRVSYHSDEIWSYGLANSADGPYIYMTDDQQWKKNMFEWSTGEVLKNYVSVAEDQRFSYKNVLYNTGLDMHPPLYFMILHTVCSLFPESYTLWYGFAINMICFIVGQFFLYAAVYLMTDSRKMALTGTILYGSCVGALSMTIFVRLYGMAVMFVIMLLYYYARMLKLKRFSFLKDILPIAVVTFFGSMTNNYFILVAFIFAACFCVYFLITKRYKTLFVFAVALLVAEGIMLCLVPNLLTRATSRVADSTSSGSVRKANYDYQLRWCVYYVSTELFGIIIRPYATMTLAYIEYFIAGVFVLAILAAFILRKEKWFGKFVWNSIYFFKKVILVLYYKIRYFPLMPIVMALSGAGVILATAYMISIPHMQEHTDRYLSVIFPLTSVLVLITIYKTILLMIQRKTRKKLENALLIVSLLIVAWNQFLFDSPYQFSMLPVDEDYMTNDELRKITAGADCILGLTQDWHLEMAPNFMVDSGNFFAFTAREYENAKEELEKIPENENEVYFIFNGDAIAPMSTYAGLEIVYEEEVTRKYTREDVENMIRELSYCDKYDYIGYTYCFDGKYEVYQIK